MTLTWEITEDNLNAMKTELARLQIAYEVELPNWKAGNVSESNRIRNEMRPIKNRIKDVERKLANKAYLKTVL